MFRVAWRGLLSRKLRLALTALSIALGVGFVAGTFVLTDTIGYAFDSLFSKTGAKVDAVVQSQSGFGSSDLTQSVRKPVPQALVDSITAVPEVGVAIGYVDGYAQIIGPDGNPAKALMGAPTLGVSTSPPELDSSTLRSGRQPTAPDEVAIDAHTASVNGFHVGDRVRIIFETGTDTFTLVGTFGFGDVDSMAGATVSVFDLHTAQVRMNRIGVYDGIYVKAAPGVGQQQVRDAVAGAVGSHFEVITGQQSSDRTSQAVSKMLGFFSTAMLVFAAIALFVGAFIIFNTFNILIAQRTRELGLLRALGAGTGQVASIVLFEALVLGVLSSFAGLGLGVGMAVGLTKLLSAVGMEMPPAPLQFLPRTLIVALAVGIGTTIVAAVIPALQTRRLSPLAALHSGLTGEGARIGWRRLAGGGAMTAAGLAVLLDGLFGSPPSRLISIGAGAMGLFFGVAVLSPVVVKPLAAGIGWPVMRMFRFAGRMGRDNAMRNPARTARTASALMIGVALVSFVAVFGDSMKASTAGALDATFKSGVLVTPPNGIGGFSSDVANRLFRVPELTNVVAVGGTEAQLSDGSMISVIGAAPEGLLSTFNISVTSGSISGLDNGGIALGTHVASSNGVHVGDTLTVVFQSTGAQRFSVVAVYDDQSGALGAEYAVSRATYDANVVSKLDVLVAAGLTPGVSSAQAVHAAKAALGSYPNLNVQDTAAYKESTLKSVDQLLSLIYTLLGLAVVIALMGIVNTLALSVLERSREIGLLRAVGMTRREVRAMIRWEAVIVALMGAVLGIAVGLAFGWLTVRAMQGNGLSAMSLPVTTLIVIVVSAGIAGVIAAIVPARRAAGLDVLRAMSME